MKRNTPRHPKVFDLLQYLGLPQRSRPLVLGYLELLWHFTSEFAPQGDIGRYSDDRIEAAMDWHGHRGKLVEALTNAGWCDKSSRCRLVVHDWHVHAEDSVKKRLARSELPFLSVAEKMTEKCPEPIRTSADNGSLPKPLPKLKPMPQPNGMRGSLAIDLNGQTSQRFEEWFGTIWEPTRGNAHRTHAAQAYLSVVLLGFERDAFECTKSYVDGPGADSNRGYRPDNFLFEMAKDQFQTRWPKNGVEPPRRLSATERAAHQWEKDHPGELT